MLKSRNKFSQPKRYHMKHSYKKRHQNTMVEATLDFSKENNNKPTKKSHFKGLNKPGELSMDPREKILKFYQKLRFCRSWYINQSIDMALKQQQSLKHWNTFNQESGANPPGTPCTASSNSIRCDNSDEKSSNLNLMIRNLLYHLNYLNC